MAEMNQSVRVYLEGIDPLSLVFEDDIAQHFDRCSRTVKRAVLKGELPPPTKLFGQPVWTVGSILKHIESRLEVELVAKAELQERIKDFSA